MGQCALQTPIIDLLNYELRTAQETELFVVVDTNENVENGETKENENKLEEIIKRINYERQLSKEINDNYVRETRKEILFPIILSLYPELNIPYEILNIVLDYEQNDSLAEIFKLFNALKTRTLCSIYVIPYVLGWIQMLIFGYLSSEYWEGIKKRWSHLLLLQIHGIILCCC